MLVVDDCPFSESLGGHALIVVVRDSTTEVGRLEVVQLRWCHSYISRECTGQYQTLKSTVLEATVPKEGTGRSEVVNSS